MTEPPGPVKVRATLGSDGHTRIVLINKQRTPSSSQGGSYTVQVPPASAILLTR